MNRNDFRFRDRLRVRWAEIDAQKIVFNGHYLMYFDTRRGWLLARARLALCADHGRASTATSTCARQRSRYHGSAHYDDLLDVGMRCARIGNSSLRLHRGGVPGTNSSSSGELVYVFADPRPQTPRPVPRSCARCCWASRPASRCSTFASAAGPNSGATRRRSGARCSVAEQRVARRPGMGRGRRDPASMRWHATARPRAGHRRAARARAGRRADRQDGGGALPARQRRRPGRARRPAAGGPRRVMARSMLRMPRLRRGFYRPCRFRRARVRVRGGGRHRPPRDDAYALTTCSARCNCGFTAVNP